MSNFSAFEAIESASLGTVTGGAPGSPPPPSPDFADKYVSNVTQDWHDLNHRMDQSAQALADTHYGEAAKQYGASVLDAVGGIGDAIAPLRALFG